MEEIRGTYDGFLQHEDAAVREVIEWDPMRSPVPGNFRKFLQTIGIPAANAFSRALTIKELFH
eukprot:1712459-Pyramimonas_sp.AAC.1